MLERSEAETEFADAEAEITDAEKEVYRCKYCEEKYIDPTRKKSK